MTSAGSLARSVRAYGAVFSVTACLCSCWTTLDPTILTTDAAGGAPTGTPQPGCSVVTRESREYMVCAEALTHAAAAEDCSKRGATLAALESSEENDFIVIDASRTISTNLWIGGTRDETFVWRWPSGSVFWRGEAAGVVEPGAYARWQPGEPNNSSNVTTDPERCLALTLVAGDWNDRSCALELPYVCER